MITDRETIMAIIDNDCLTKSDVAVLLEGDGFNRYQKAVELYKTGIVSKIVFSGNILDKEYGSYPFEEIKPLILASGVLEQDIVYENQSRNTYEQAVEIIKLANKNEWKKLVLVASSDHQYRAYLTFLRQVLDSESEILLFNAPSRNLPWFLNEGWGIRLERLSKEFERIEKYTTYGHLASAQEVVEYQMFKESKVYEKNNNSC